MGTGGTCRHLSPSTSSCGSPNPSVILTRTILGSSDCSCVLKKGRDGAGKEAGRVGGKGSVCVPPEGRGREEPSLHWLQAQPHAACWLGLVLQEIPPLLQVPLVPMSCGIVWGRVLSVTACRMSPVTAAKPRCAGRLCSCLLLHTAVLMAAHHSILLRIILG